MNAIRTHWIFGYGSLLWNPGFPYLRSQKVEVPGWSRRLWQGSTDHRGTPEYPGVVCTLVAAAHQSCWGLAYEVSGDDWPAIRLELDYREKDGYQLEVVQALGPGGEPRPCWCYVARPDNPSFLGQPSLPELVRRIARARGPSGTSRDYLRRLLQRLSELEIADPHVEQLWRELNRR